MVGRVQSGGVSDGTAELVGWYGGIGIVIRNEFRDKIRAPGLQSKMEKEIYIN